MSIFILKYTIIRANCSLFVASENQKINSGGYQKQRINTEAMHSIVIQSTGKALCGDVMHRQSVVMYCYAQAELCAAK